MLKCTSLLCIHSYWCTVHTVNICIRYTDVRQKYFAACVLYCISNTIFIPLLQGWAKLVLIALERYSVALKRLTFNYTL